MMTTSAFIAQAQTAPPPAPPMIAMLFPWLFLGLIMGLVLATMAKRKGKNPLLWFILGFIPLVGFFLAFVLASHPDVELLNRIRRLEQRLAVDLTSASRVKPPPL